MVYYKEKHSQFSTNIIHKKGANWQSMKTSCVFKCIYIIVQRFIAKYFKYGGHLGELYVTQIRKYRDLTFVRETGQINAGLHLSCMFLLISNVTNIK